MSCDPKVKVKFEIMLFTCKCIYSLNRLKKQLQILQVHRSHYVEGTGKHSYSLDAKVNDKGKNMGICEGVPSTAV